MSQAVSALSGFEQASDGTKQITEIMPHPASGDADDREAYASPVQQLMPSVTLVGGPDFDPEAEVLDHGSTREIGVQVGHALHLNIGFPVYDSLPLALYHQHVPCASSQRKVNR